MSYVVIWSGRGAMPHELVDAEYWQQPRNSTLEAAPEVSDRVRGSSGAIVDNRSAPPDRPHPVTAACRRCRRKYRTRIPRLRLYCDVCAKENEAKD